MHRLRRNSHFAFTVGAQTAPTFAFSVHCRCRDCDEVRRMCEKGVYGFSHREEMGEYVSWKKLAHLLTPGPFSYALMQDFKHSALFSILRRIALRWFSHFERQNCANLKKHRKDRRYSFRKVLKYVELSKIYYGCVRKPPRSIFSTKRISPSPPCG